MLIAEREINPWGDALGSLQLNADKFPVARSPLSALLSVMGENRDARSFAWRSQVNWSILGIDLLAPDVIPQTPLAWAVASWTLRYEIALRFDPILIHRVERPEDDADLSRCLAVPMQRNEAIARNSRPEQRAGLHFEPQMLARVAQRLGYPEDAEVILNHARPSRPPHRQIHGPHGSAGSA